LQQEDAAMSSADCTHSIQAERRPSGVILWALAWLGLRWLGYGLMCAAEAGPVWLERSRQRRQLAQLSDHMLRDIGLTRVDAWAEAEKPFWRP
jgi:uncharacterized protein YjiS (DUF1127 family)